MTDTTPILHINSTFVDDRPMVYWAYGERSGLLTLTEARTRAELIFKAAGIAESEATIFKAFKSIDLDAKPKGFGKPNKPPKRSSSSELVAGSMLQLLREHRPEFPKEIQIIFGLKTQQALIELYYYGDRIQETPEIIRNHAIGLIEAAEAAESDAFLYRFFRDSLDIEPEKLQPIMAEFQEFRLRGSLENLFNTEEK